MYVTTASEKIGLDTKWFYPILNSAAYQNDQVINKKCQIRSKYLLIILLFFLHLLHKVSPTL